MCVFLGVYMYECVCFWVCVCVCVCLCLCGGVSLSVGVCWGYEVSSDVVKIYFEVNVNK